MVTAAEALSMLWSSGSGEQIQNSLDEWCRDLDLRDNYSGSHSRLATQLALMLARRQRLDGETTVALAVTGHVYDIGKIAVPAEVLRKNGALTDAEWIMMRRHVACGYDLLRDWPMLRQGPRWLFNTVMDIVLCHHERWDGAGYPQGKHGKEIPLGARIMAIADTYAAMTMNSPYRRALPSEVAIEELENKAGSQFDPSLVPPFVSIVRLAAREGALDHFYALNKNLVPVG